MGSGFVWVLSSLIVVGKSKENPYYPGSEEDLGWFAAESWACSLADEQEMKSTSDCQVNVIREVRDKYGKPTSQGPRLGT